MFKCARHYGEDRGKRNERAKIPSHHVCSDSSGRDRRTHARLAALTGTSSVAPPHLKSAPSAPRVEQYVRVGQPAPTHPSIHEPIPRADGCVHHTHLAHRRSAAVFRVQPTSHTGALSDSLLNFPCASANAAQRRLFGIEPDTPDPLRRPCVPHRKNACLPLAGKLVA